MKLTLVTPEKRVLIAKEVLEVTLPAFRGELNILPGHQPLITTLVPGVIHYKAADGSKNEMAASISWGYCNVSPEGVNVLAETVEFFSEINFESAKTELEEAQNRMLKDTMDDDTWKHVQEKIAHSKARLSMEKYN